jgi:imidazolonepropionase-like amidohydrolase
LKKTKESMLCNVFVLVTLLAAIGHAQVTSSGIIAIRASWLLDGIHDRPIANAVVLVRGERIAQVGTNLPIPQDALIIDLGNRTLLPGIIDCHTHLLQNFDPALPGGEELNMLQTVATMSTAKRALLGAAMAREDLNSGITTVRDLGNSGLNGDVALRDAIASNWVQGPRMLVSTRALAPAGGQFGETADGRYSTLDTAAQGLIAQEYVVIGSVDDAHRAVRQAFYDGADLIKVIVSEGPRTLSPEEMRAIVEDAHRVHRKVAAHAIGDDATRLAAEAGVDSIEHAYTMTDDVLKMMAAKHIFLVPTDGPEQEYIELLSGGLPKASANEVLARAHRAVERRSDRLKRAIAFRVPIAAGSDMYWNLNGHTRGENSVATLGAYADEGMSAGEIIRAATSNAAELLGRDDIGSLEAGRFADMIAVSGNPLSDASTLEHVTFVMKGGVVIRNQEK